MNPAFPQGVAQLTQVHGVAAEQLVDEDARLAAAAVVPQHQRVFLRRIVFRAPAHEVPQGLGIRHALKGQALLQEEALRQVVVQVALIAPALQGGVGDIHPQPLGVPLLAATGFDQHVDAPRIGHLGPVHQGFVLFHHFADPAVGIDAAGDLLQVAGGIAVSRFQIGAAHVKQHRPLVHVFRRLRERRGRADQQHRADERQQGWQPFSLHHRTPFDRLKNARKGTA